MNSLLLCLCYAHSSSASSTFYPTCTSPTDVVNFVGSTSVRGTLDILWSSLFTLLICTWTVQHLNIPRQTEDPTTLLQKLKGAFLRSGIKIKWMLITLIVPELLVGKAYQDWEMAKRSRDEMKSIANEDGVKWTLTHAYYANMGGVIFKVALDSEEQRSVHDLKTHIQPHVQPISPQTSAVEEVHPALIASDEDDIVQVGVGPAQTPTFVSSVLTEQDEVHQVKQLPEEESSPADQPIAASVTPPSDDLHQWEYAYPNADQILSLRENSILTRLPDISSKQIEEKSKSDGFVKGTAILQVLWLVIQIIARGSKHLPVSQLEIAVLAFSVCALLTYLLSWDKPQNITLADLGSSIIFPRHVFTNLEKAQDYGTSWTKNLFLQHEINIFKPIPNDAEAGPLPGSEFLTATDIGMGLAGTIFGALHLIAWNFHFPSYVESLLWKLASLYLAAVLPLCYGLAWFFEWVGVLKGVFNNKNPKPQSRIKMIITKLGIYIPVLSYVLARVTLMVLVFRSLFFLEPGTFGEPIPRLEC